MGELPPGVKNCIALETQQAGPPLISPATVGGASLFVNAIVGSALLLWNAIWLKQWGHALLALVFGGLGAVLVKTSFQPNLYWLMGHFFSAACLILVSRTQRDGYHGHLYDGGGRLPLAPLVSLLCALQILYLDSLSQAPAKTAKATRPTPIPVAVATTPAAAPNQGSMVYREGQLLVEYKDVDLAQVQLITRVLVEHGLCETQQPGRAAVLGTPQFLGIIAVLPAEVTEITPAIEAVFQQALTRLTSAQNPPRPVGLEVYFHDHRPAGSYQLSQP